MTAVIMMTIMSRLWVSDAEADSDHQWWSPRRPGRGGIIPSHPSPSGTAHQWSRWMVKSITTAGGWPSQAEVLAAGARACAAGAPPRGGRGIPGTAGGAGASVTVRLAAESHWQAAARRRCRRVPPGGDVRRTCKSRRLGDSWRPSPGRAYNPGPGRCRFEICNGRARLPARRSQLDRQLIVVVVHWVCPGKIPTKQNWILWICLR